MLAFDLEQQVFIAFVEQVRSVVLVMMASQQHRLFTLENKKKTSALNLKRHKVSIILTISDKKITAAFFLFGSMATKVLQM